MKIPVITGEGKRIELDSDDYVRLVMLPELCSDIDPHLWELFAEEEPVTGRTSTRGSHRSRRGRVRGSAAG